MPISGCFRGLREKIGHDLVLNPAVAAVIRDGDGNVLVQQRSDNGLWEIPAGAIDPDEAPAQAVVREALAFRYVRPSELPRQFIFPNHVSAADFTGVYFAWDDLWLEGLE